MSKTLEAPLASDPYQLVLAESHNKQVWLEQWVALINSLGFAVEYREILWDALIELRRALYGTVRSRETLETDYIPMVWPIGPRGRCEACEL